MELCLGGRRLAEGGLRYTSEGICIVVVRCCIIEASRYLIVIHPYAEGEGLVSCIPARAIFRSWCSYSLALCSLGVFFSCLLYRLFTAACFCFASCSEKTKVRLFWFVSVPFFFVLFFFLVFFSSFFPQSILGIRGICIACSFGCFRAAMALDFAGFEPYTELPHVMPR